MNTNTDSKICTAFVVYTLSQKHAHHTLLAEYIVCETLSTSSLHQACSKTTVAHNLILSQKPLRVSKCQAEN